MAEIITGSKQIIKRMLIQSVSSDFKCKYVIREKWNTNTYPSTLSSILVITYLMYDGDDSSYLLNPENISETVSVNQRSNSVYGSSYTNLIKNEWKSPFAIEFVGSTIDTSQDVDISISLSISGLDNNNTATNTVSFKYELNDPTLYEICDDDKSYLQTGSAVILTKVIIEPGTDNELVLTESDSVKDWTYTDERYVDETSTFIGEFIARDLSGELQNISDDFNIENKTIEVQLGVMRFGEKETDLVDNDDYVLITEDGENTLMRDADKINIKNYTTVDTNWYSLGFFNVLEPEDNEVSDNTKFDTFDLTVLFNKNFDADYTDNIFTTSFNDAIQNGEYFTTSDLAKYTCAQVGIKFPIEDFPHSDDIITSNQFTGGDSCRDVMKAISKSGFGWCRLGWDNKCYIDNILLNRQNISAYDTITNNHYYSLETKKEKYGPINRVVIGMEDIEGQDVFVENSESIEQYGVNELDIFDNPLTYTQDLRTQAIKGANYALFGLEYVPFETETLGHPWLKAKNPIAIVDMEGNTKYSYPFKLTIKYTGHIKTDISAPNKTKAEIRTQYDDSLYKEIRKLGITVNRATGVIELLNNRMTVAEDGISSLETTFINTITDTYSKQEIQKIITGIGVDGNVVTSVQTNSGTFDENGMTYEKSGAETSTVINESGINTKNSSGQSVLFAGFVDSNNTDYPDYAGQTIVGTDNIVVHRYLNIGEHSRIQDYRTGTGIFHR